MHLEPLATVVVPVWKDRRNLTELLRTLSRYPQAETIVVLADEDCATYGDLEREHAWVKWTAGPRGRASQMNAGAAMARGRWLVFLHVDSRLPASWLDEIARVDRLAAITGGAYRFALDSPCWQARMMEHLVRLRVRLLGLPYGDQALFARRSVFERLGGYRDLPLMEDIDLVQRLKRVGRLAYSPLSVITSARRWEREGWWRRSGRNLFLATRFLLGASPARLAREYYGRSRVAVVMLARAPWTGGKTRIVLPDEKRHRALREALCLDTLDRIRALERADRVVACEPVEAVVAMSAMVGPDVDVVGQRGSSLGDRMAHAFADVFRLGHEVVVLIGSDLPDLPLDRLSSAVRALGRGDRVVLGPATDGGYYLVGLRRPHPELFLGIDWEAANVLEQTRRQAAALGLSVVLLGEWSDVDDAADLTRLQAGPDDVAIRTREWVRKSTMDAASGHQS